jgi:TM2 domain-containing membrane protein YozV
MKQLVLLIALLFTVAGIFSGIHYIINNQNYTGVVVILLSIFLVVTISKLTLKDKQLNKQ